MSRCVLLLLSLSIFACGPGEPGPMGPAGPAGASGVGLKSDVFCTGFATVDSTGGGYSMSYDYYTFSDGSAFVTCEVRGGRNSGFYSVMYAKGTPGAAEGACRAQFDADSSATQGKWKFTILASKTTARVVYDDPGSAFNGTTAILSCETF